MNPGALPLFMFMYKDKFTWKSAADIAVGNDTTAADDDAIATGNYLAAKHS
jgi:hypothetical protein